MIMYRNEGNSKHVNDSYTPEYVFELHHFSVFFLFFFSSLDSCVDFSWHSFDEQEKCYIFYFGTEYSNDPAEIKLFGI